MNAEQSKKREQGRMKMNKASRTLDRRNLLKGVALAGLAQVASPFVVRALGEEPVKIGLVDSLTGALAALAQNEVAGAKLAVDEINAKGGILGRPIQLLV